MAVLVDGTPAAPAAGTGLTAREILQLSDVDVQALAMWHAGKAGDDDGRPWWPDAVRQLPLDVRLTLASDPLLDAAWERRERQRVVDDVVYFTAAYGHVQPNQGPPVPFRMWPEQRDVLRLFRRRRRVVVLKARQLGLTWLALHDAAHLIAFDPGGGSATVLALSKHGGDATNLIKRVRRIFRLLPPYLRIMEAAETRQSKSECKLRGRGRILSLAGTPEAARQQTAALAISDEGAFIRNRQAQPTFAALGPTLGATGRGIYISTGNGDEETPGDGQAFARLYGQAAAGAVEVGDDGGTIEDVAAVFLPTSVHPDRDEAFYRTARRDYLSDEDFRREYPETEDEALAGNTGTKVYSLAGVTAAVRMGRDMDALFDAAVMNGGLPGRLPPPVDDTGDGEGVHPFIDWGMGMTFIGTLWPLEGGGVYIPPDSCIAVRHGEPGQATLAYLTLVERLQRRGPSGMLYPPLAEARYDAAGAQSMATFLATCRGGARPAMWRRDSRLGRHEVASLGINFGGSSNVRGETRGGPARSYKQLGIGYLQRLFDRAAEGRTVGVIKISPRGEGNETLVRQLRGLEFRDDDQGAIRKVDDHGPDALIAGVAPIAVRWLDALGSAA